MAQAGRQLSGTEQIIAGVFVLLVLAAVFIISHATQQRQLISGPQQMVADAQQNIWVLTNQDTVWRLSADGAVQRRFTAEQLGMKKPLGPLTLLPDGEWMVGDRHQETLHFFTQQGGPLRVLDPAHTATGALSGAFFMVYDPLNQRYVVSDSSNHRLLAFDSQGQPWSGEAKAAELEEGAPAVPASTDASLRFPNELLYDNWQRLWVVDTNHHRLAQLDAHLQVVGEIALNGFNVWPVTAAADGEGGFFVFAGIGDLDAGPVLHLDRHGEQLARFDLPAGANPFGIVVRGREVLVADAMNFAIYRFSTDGSRLGVFGDASFQGVMDGLHHRYQYYWRLERGAQVFIVLALLALIGVYVYQQRSGGGAASVAGSGGQGALRRSALPAGGDIGDLYGHNLRLMAPLLAVALTPPLVLLGVALLLHRLLHMHALPLIVELELALVLTVLVAVTVAPWLRRHYVRAWQQGEFARALAMNAAMIYNLCRRRIEDALQPGESVRERILWRGGSPWRSPGLLLWSDERLFLMRRRLLSARVEAIAFEDIREARWSPDWEARSSWWREFVPARRLLLRTVQGDRELEIVDWVGGERLLAKIQLTANTRPLTEADRTPAMPRAELGFSPWRSALLSALVPGLGQFFQERKQLALVFLLLCGGLLIVDIPVFSVLVFHNMDMNLAAAIQLILMLPLAWGVNIYDAYQNGRVSR